MNDLAWNIRAWFLRLWDRITGAERHYWHYCIYEDHNGLGYNICEVHASSETGIHSWTGPLCPMGDTIDELIWDLEHMLKDAKKCKRLKRRIVATSEETGYVVNRGKRIEK